MPPHYFPDPAESPTDGCLAVGGSLSPQMLLDAYRHRIFPWPSGDFLPLEWWSPDPRAILPLDGFHASKRLERRIRSGQFSFSLNRAFAEVIEGCATGPGRKGATWITTAMIEGYSELHRLGHAQSVEVWQAEQLVGGVYGVSLGGLFAAESMFHRTHDASKAALFHLVRHLNSRGYQLLDIQQWTPHTGSLGAIVISRQDYLQRLAKVVDLPVGF